MGDCNCKNKVSRGDIFKYSYYNKEGKVIAVLDEEKLKKILDADELVFNEIEEE